MIRMVMVVLGVASAAIVLGALWIDGGEIVALLTTDADSKVHETELWSVELDGVHYLRASNSEPKAVPPAPELNVASTRQNAVLG